MGILEEAVKEQQEERTAQSIPTPQGESRQETIIEKAAREKKEERTAQSIEIPETLGRSRSRSRSSKSSKKSEPEPIPEPEKVPEKEPVQQTLKVEETDPSGQKLTREATILEKAFVQQIQEQSAQSIDPNLKKARIVSGDPPYKVNGSVSDERKSGIKLSDFPNLEPGVYNLPPDQITASDKADKQFIKEKISKRIYFLREPPAGERATFITSSAALSGAVEGAKTLGVSAVLLGTGAAISYAVPPAAPAVAAIEKGLFTAYVGTTSYKLLKGDFIGDVEAQTQLLTEVVGFSAMGKSLEFTKTKLTEAKTKKFEAKVEESFTRDVDPEFVFEGTKTETFSPSAVDKVTVNLAEGQTTIPLTVESKGLSFKVSPTERQTQLQRKEVSIGKEITSEGQLKDIKTEVNPIDLIPPDVKYDTRFYERLGRGEKQIYSVSKDGKKIQGFVTKEGKFVQVLIREIPKPTAKSDLVTELEIINLPPKSQKTLSEFPSEPTTDLIDLKDVRKPVASVLFRGSKKAQVQSILRKPISKGRVIPESKLKVFEKTDIKSNIISSKPSEIKYTFIPIALPDSENIILSGSGSFVSETQVLSQVKEPSQAQKPVQVQEPLQVQTPSQSRRSVSIQEPSQVQQPIQVQEPLQVQDPIQSQKQSPLVMPDVSLSETRYRSVQNKFKEFRPLPGVRLRGSEPDRSESLFSVIVGKKGRVVYFEKRDLNLSEAIEFGRSSVESTAAASFRIVPDEDTDSSYLDEIKSRLGRKFRKAKKEEDVFVQKREFRISSFGEKQDITFKGISSKRKKSKLKLF